MWSVLIFLLVLVAVNWWDYSTSVQEYTIAQPKHADEIGALMGDKTPIVVELAVPVPPAGAEIGEATAETMGLTLGLTDLDAARRWWWMPELRGCRVDKGARGLTWVGAERQWVGAMDGEMTLWLVHSRYRRWLPEGGDGSVDPWTLTKETAPWIGRVQYIEVSLKPGWCIGLPGHWGYALRPVAGTPWIWTAEQHSFVSLVRQMVSG